MAMTETSVPVDAQPGELPASTGQDGSTVRAEPTGLGAIIATGDHKVLGRMWITVSLLFGLGSLGLVAAAAWGQRTGATFPDPDHQFQVFTLGRISLVFLFLVPLFIGIATLVCPLQVGASTVAFPRAAAAAFWTWLVGSGLLIAGYVSNGGVGTPAADGSVNKGVDLAYAGLGIVVVALLLATVCIVTTVVALRTPGMDLFRVPLFSWSMIVAGAAWLLSLPVFLGNILLIAIDYHSGGSVQFGQKAAQWPQLAWVFGQPQIFAFAIPALGVACDVVATFARNRQPQRGVLMGAIGAFGVLSIGAWAQNVFYPDLYNQIVFIGVSALLVVPLLVLLGGLVANFRAGAPRPTGPLVAAFVSILMLLLGWVGALLFVIKPLQLHEITPDSGPNLTSFVNTFWSPVYPAAQVGVTAIVALAALTGALAGLFYWGPKITGHRMTESGGFLVALGMLIATLALGPPYLAFAFATKSPSLDSSLDSFSAISLVGAAIAALVVLLTLLLLAQSALSKATAPDDPWGDGQTLEWATATPPVKGNFAPLDDIASPEPLLDWREAEATAAPAEEATT
jgi:cytochrome c oxidase subunit 1